MVNDQEPRYRLVDADGDVVGSLFAESDGTLKLQEGTSGNDNELALTKQGAVEVEQVSNGSVSSIAQYDYGMGDGETRQLDPQNPERPAVYIVYTDTGTFTGIFATDTVGSESVTKVAGGDVTTTDGNTGTLNVYWNDSAERFEIENQATFTLNVSVTRTGFNSIAAANSL